MPTSTGGGAVTSQSQVAANTIGSSQIIDTEIVNADISASAAIVDTKLAQIATASKVSGAALTSLASIPAGAGVIPAANVPSGADLVLFVAPASGKFTATVEAEAIFDVMSFADGSTQYWEQTVKVPIGATSISSIVLLYKRQNTGNLFMRFRLAHFDAATVGDAEVQDATDTGAAYAGGAADSTLGRLTVPTTSYDGLPAISANDIIAMEIQRLGGNASDTYASAFVVYGVEWTFA